MYGCTIVTLPQAPDHVWVYHRDSSTGAGSCMGVPSWLFHRRRIMYGCTIVTLPRAPGSCLGVPSWRSGRRRIMYGCSIVTFTGVRIMSECSVVTLPLVPGSNMVVALLYTVCLAWELFHWRHRWVCLSSCLCMYINLVKGARWATARQIYGSIHLQS
jgi:hypothetical protein